jgi:pimeloyl-ACP methyl ester carboxylesterase
LLGNPERDAPAFHIVAPSLPNFGFSEGPKECGFALKQYAETCHKLMLQLGYNHYSKMSHVYGMNKVDRLQQPKEAIGAPT